MKWVFRLVLVLTIALLTASVWMGIGWGLPSKHADHYLFGQSPIWDGATLAKFDQASSDQSIGADVDLNPLDKSQPEIVLNDTDAQRAEIIRRYRLYSNQPDEMITFRALQQMKPGSLQLDPHLYQYGGLWIYGTGVLLKIAHALDYVTITSDKSFYYDHPEEFGKFYIVARCYTLICYALLLVIVGLIANRIFNSRTGIFCSILLVGTCPVVFAMAHEAKPHLPGAMLMCLACLMMMRFLRSWKLKDAILVGVTCGLAMGMVLSAVVIAAMLPFMLILKIVEWKKRKPLFLAALLSMLVVYFATNPFVLINLLVNRAALSSNLGNTQAMYHFGSPLEMLADAGDHLQNALTIWILIPGIVGMFLYSNKRIDLQINWLAVLPPFAVSFIQFILFCQDKPAEYARFAIFPAITFCLYCVIVLMKLHQRWMSLTAGLGLAGLMIYLQTWAYVEAFDNDSISAGSSRMTAAANIQSLPDKNRIVQIFTEPAPYSIPPVGLWDRKIVLTPLNTVIHGDVVIMAVDHPHNSKEIPGYTRKIYDSNQPDAPITWANKPVVVWYKNP